MRGGWTHLDPFRATRDVIAPLTFGLLGMLLFPAGALWVVQKLFGLPLGDDFLCKSLVSCSHLSLICSPVLHVYPSIFTLAGFGHTVLVGTRVLGSWSQGIRDKEFLVEMRLQNLESESSNGADAKQPDKPYKETLVAQEQMQIDDRDDAEAALGVREEEEEEED